MIRESCTRLALKHEEPGLRRSAAGQSAAITEAKCQLAAEKREDFSSVEPKVCFKMEKCGGGEVNGAALKDPEYQGWPLGLSAFFFFLIYIFEDFFNLQTQHGQTKTNKQQSTIQHRRRKKQ